MRVVTLGQLRGLGAGGSGATLAYTFVGALYVFAAIGVWTTGKWALEKVRG